MKNLVFPRIFLHCVALGFIVSGLLLSGRSGVRITSGTPLKVVKSLIFKDLAIFRYRQSCEPLSETLTNALTFVGFVLYE